jgi:hypothetical protein
MRSGCCFRNDDPFDARFDEFAIDRMIDGGGRRQMFADRASSNRFDVRRRDAGNGASLILPTLQQRVRDVLAIAHALLGGVARTHGVAAIVKNLAE